MRKAVNAIWPHFLTAVFAIIVSYLTSTWASNAEMYKVALAGLGAPNVPIQTRYLYLEIIAQWEGVPLPPEKIKRIAEEMSAQNATLESLDPAVPGVRELQTKIATRTLWDDLYGVKNLYEVKDLHNVRPDNSQGTETPLPQLSPPSNAGKPVNPAPGDNTGPDLLPAPKTKNEVETRD